MTLVRSILLGLFLVLFGVGHFWLSLLAFWTDGELDARWLIWALVLFCTMLVAGYILIKTGVALIRGSDWTVRHARAFVFIIFPGFLALDLAAEIAGILSDDEYASIFNVLYIIIPMIVPSIILRLSIKRSLL